MFDVNIYDCAFNAQYLSLRKNTMSFSLKILSTELYDIIVYIFTLSLHALINYRLLTFKWLLAIKLTSSRVSWLLLLNTFPLSPQDATWFYKIYISQAVVKSCYETTPLQRFYYHVTICFSIYTIKNTFCLLYKYCYLIFSWKCNSFTISICILLKNHYMFDLSFMLFIGQHCQDKRIEKKTRIALIYRYWTVLRFKLYEYVFL